MKKKNTKNETLSEAYDTTPMLTPNERNSVELIKYHDRKKR